MNVAVAVLAQMRHQRPSRFIPPHLAEEVVVSSENVRLRDEFGQQRIAEGVYTPGEVDRVFSEEMERDFEGWAANRGPA